MFVIIWLLLVIVLPANIVNAQNNPYSIIGNIVDNNSNLPLFYVSVELLNEADSTAINFITTDKDGTFKFLNIETGNYIIKTSYIGYDIYQESVSVMGKNKEEIKLETIFLQPTATKLPNVTISAKKPIYMDDGEKSLYNVSEDPSVQTGTVADALQYAPGVEVDIEGNVTLRGNSNVEIWINGRPSRLNAENLKNYIQQLPANSLERIEVITNPSARYSAEGTGGIINIVTKSNIKRNSFISFGLNGSTRPMASPWVSYMFSNKKFSINLYLSGYYNFTNSKLNGYTIILDDNMDTSSYRNYTDNQKGNSISTIIDISGAYRFDSLKTISFWGRCYPMPFSQHEVFQDYKYQEFINNHGIYDYLEKATYKSVSISGDFGVEYEHKFNNNGHKIVTEIFGEGRKRNQSNNFQRSYKNYSELNKNRKTINNVNSYNFGGKIYYNLPYHKQGVIEMGIEGLYSSETLNRKTDTLFSNIYVLDSMRYENSVSDRSDLNAYIIVQHKFGDFTIKGGLRSENRFLNYSVISQPEYNHKKFYLGLFPSLHLSYSTKSKHNFNLSYTRRVNYPNNSQLSTFIKYFEDNFSIGNSELKSTFTNSIEGGWRKFFPKFGSVGLTAYFKHNKDEINDIT
ncbi:MAG: outer membrane beta-barrel protein, partial [Firmicutes bacterium]|nr:outer membrane beta-barrel protein [Bacillota bacterium]